MLACEVPADQDHDVHNNLKRILSFKVKCVPDRDVMPATVAGAEAELADGLLKFATGEDLSTVVVLLRPREK